MTEERKDAAHIFERTIIGSDPDFKEEHDAKIEEKLKNFEWDDSQETKDNLPAVPFRIEDVDECVSILLDCLSKGITTEHFDGSDPSGMRFVIPVNVGLHKLLRDRFVEEWDLESRLEMFDAIQAQLSTIFFADVERKTELNTKILDALPPSHRKKFESDDIHLVDDAMTVGEESNTVSLEVPIHFVAN